MRISRAASEIKLHSRTNSWEDFPQNKYTLEITRFNLKAGKHSPIRLRGFFFLYIEFSIITISDDRVWIKELNFALKASYIIDGVRGLNIQRAWVVVGGTIFAESVMANFFVVKTQIYLELSLVKMLWCDQEMYT